VGDQGHHAMAESAERTIVKMTWTATTVDGALRIVVAVLILVALPNTTRAQQSPAHIEA